MSEASDPQQMTGAALAQELLDCLTIGLEVDEFDVANLEEAAKRLREWDYMRAGGCARDQRTTQYCAEAVAATARAEKAERALRLEQGRPAEGDLPNGWRHHGPGYFSTRAEAVKSASHPVGCPWLAQAWDDDDEVLSEYYATAAEAIDAAQAALEGGDDA